MKNSKKINTLISETSRSVMQRKPSDIARFVGKSRDEYEEEAPPIAPARLTANIDRNLHLQLKLYAVKRRKNLNIVVEEIISSFLKEKGLI